jgi:hypothetical protein
LSSQRDEYKGHKIEIRKSGEKEELFIDNSSLKYGQLPNGLYFLEKYAFDWKENLTDLSKEFVDYRATVEEIRHERRPAKGKKEYMSRRKNYRDLTAPERERFAQGLHHVKSTGLVDENANLHDDHFGH